MRPRFCTHGHDTTVAGRYRNGNCKACIRVKGRNYKAEHRRRKAMRAEGLVPLDKIYIDAEPLRHWVSSGRTRLTAEMLDRFSSQRYRNAGKIQLSLADEICTALAMHPIEVFGPEWDVA